MPGSQGSRTQQPAAEPLLSSLCHWGRSLWAPLALPLCCQVTARGFRSSWSTGNSLLELLEFNASKQKLARELRRTCNALCLTKWSEGWGTGAIFVLLKQNNFQIIISPNCLIRDKEPISTDRISRICLWLKPFPCRDSREGFLALDMGAGAKPTHPPAFTHEQSCSCLSPALFLSPLGLPAHPGTVPKAALTLWGWILLFNVLPALNYYTIIAGSLSQWWSMSIPEGR